MSLEELRKALTFIAVLVLLYVSVCLLVQRGPLHEGPKLISKDDENGTNSKGINHEHDHSVPVTLAVLYILTCSLSVLFMKLRIPGLLGRSSLTLIIS